MDYRVEIDDEGVQAALDSALARFNDLTPLMNDIAGVLEDEAQSAFREQRSPKGRGWARQSAGLHAHYFCEILMFLCPAPAQP